jgi:hypothetical protein
MIGLRSLERQLGLILYYQCKCYYHAKLRIGDVVEAIHGQLIDGFTITTLQTRLVPHIKHMATTMAYNAVP